DAMEVVDYSAYEEQIRKLVDKQVIGKEVREPEGVYLVHQLGQAEEPKDWSEEKTRNETDLIRTRLRKTIEQDLADDPYAQKVFGELLRQVPESAREAMRQAVAPFLHVAPPGPIALPAPARPAPKPAQILRRHAGAALHVSVGGHRVVLRTAEDGEGRLLEVAFTLSKEGAAFRSLMDAFAQSVSMGLQRGVPLADYVEAFAYTRFGPAGLVEGDPAIPRATSVLDWAFRRLALDYLGRRDLPQPSEADCLGDSVGHAAEMAPLLPLDLPAAASPRGRRRSLRVVG
ncbi:MAG: hypothetical protein ACOYOH_24440, partial [Paracraurococcus sp.]